MDILTATASTLAREIEAGKLDPLAITQAYLDNIANCEYSENIYSVVTNARALEEAEAASKRAASGTRLSFFDGIPVSWKDLFDTEGVATEGGSRLLQGRIPERDCEVVRRAKNAGMICLGKTHLSELAFSGLGINPMTATSPNRYDINNAPGGSSSGAAASVAYNLAPIAIGSDTGGSVRIPSAWNDLIGLKTTHGAIPLDGVIALCSSFDTVGPLARSVEDAFHMYGILSGNSARQINQRSISTMKFLVCETNVLSNCDEAQLKGFEHTVNALNASGAGIEYGAIPEFEEMVELGPTMFPHEAFQQWGTEIETAPEAVFAPVRKRFLAGKSISNEQDQAARARMMELRALYNTRTTEYDGVIMPTTPIGPPHVQTLLEDHDLFWDVNLRALSNTRYGNMFGLCALTLPTSVQTAGLMIFSKPGSDMELLGLGAAIEQIVAA